MSNFYKNSWKRKLGKKKDTVQVQTHILPENLVANKRSNNVNLTNYPIHGYSQFNTHGIEAPTIFNNHDDGYCLDSRLFYPDQPQYIQAVFIDPGLVSCSIRIVKYIIGTGQIINVWFGIHNFGIGIDQMIKGVEDGLESIKQTLIMSHHIVIESQYMKKEVNFRTFQHMISYIESCVRNKGMKAVIFEVSISLKTVFIGGPKTLKQNNGVDIKEWSKIKARYILLQRCDWTSLSILECTLDKQDEDYSDTVCYEYAWWFYIRLIKDKFKDVVWLHSLL